MLQPRAVSGDAFRATLVVVAVMLLALIGAGSLVYTQTTAALQSQLKSLVAEDVSLVQAAYAEAGEQGMVEFIQHATATRSRTAFAFGMFTLQRVYMTGTVRVEPEVSGWTVIPAAAMGGARNSDILAFSSVIGNHLVVVGRSLHEVQATGLAILQALALAGVLISVVGLATAYAFGRLASAKLRGMAEALEQVSRGNSDIRLPVGAANDQIDFVSREINSYLDRLSELMGTMRNTAIAIAHDLRSPLNRMSILIQEAAEAGDRAEILLGLDKVQEEMDGLKAILDTVMRISRIEASDDIASFEPVDLGPLLDDLVQTFEPMLAADGQSICFLPPVGAIAPAFGDRRMIQQLVVNLIQNAARYAGPGARVEVTAMASAAGPMVVVADNGPGIPADKRAAVFQPFFRLDPERNALGAGLGLALVKAIAARHRAEVVLADAGPGLRVMVTFADQAGFGAR